MSKEQKTMEGWAEHATETGESGIGHYLKEGDRVSQDIVDYLAEIVPPKTLQENLFQVGPPYDLHQGDGSNKHPTYSTFFKDGEGWKYCGFCFEGGAKRSELFPTNREDCFFPPEYQYDTGDSNIERVRITVGTYKFGNNLYVGLDHFDSDLGRFNVWKNATVNVSPLSLLTAAVDVGNDEMLVDFLEKNSIATKTNISREDGCCRCPVMIFNPVSLLRADPEGTEEHLRIRGIDPDIVASKKKEVLRNMEKDTTKTDRGSLDSLKQEAKERADEKNAAQEKLVKKNPSRER